ncbi:Importin alpha subunit (Karyopherin alpha subunit) (Serine-rich RNA polymerase I suppressor protein), partial [Mortierella sp. AD032]
DNIRKEACWTISNVTAGTCVQIQDVIDANIIPPLINILQNADFKTKKEACWAISNATSGGLNKPDQIRYLVTQGCIKPLCDILICMDNKIIQVALDGLENILKVGEMDKEQTNGKAFTIIDTYFTEEDDEDPELAPQVDAQTGAFAFQAGGVPQGGFNFDPNAMQ